MVRVILVQGDRTEPLSSPRRNCTVGYRCYSTKVVVRKIASTRLEHAKSGDQGCVRRCFLQRETGGSDQTTLAGDLDRAVAEHLNPITVFTGTILEDSYDRSFGGI